MRGVNRLLIEPSQIVEVETSGCSLVRSMTCALANWRLAHVMLVCRPASALLHAVHSIASAVPCSLMVLGVDDAESFRIGLALEGNDKDVLAPSTLVNAAQYWPLVLRQAVERVCDAPADWPVKRLATSAGMSRRTLERHFADAGLPGPGAVLRSLRLSVDSARAVACT